MKTPYCAAKWSIIIEMTRNKPATDLDPTNPTHTVAKVNGIEDRQGFLPTILPVVCMSVKLGLSY
jgi:hypothetical protein